MTFILQVSARRRWSPVVWTPSRSRCSSRLRTTRSTPLSTRTSTRSLPRLHRSPCRHPRHHHRRDRRLSSSLLHRQARWPAWWRRQPGLVVCCWSCPPCPQSAERCSRSFCSRMFVSVISSALSSPETVSMATVGACVCVGLRVCLFVP